MGITVNSRPIETGIKYFLSSVVRTMISPGRSIMASREDINDFLVSRDSPLLFITKNDIEYLEYENPPEQSQLSILLSKKILKSRV
ncbi:hypothetical protein Tco_1139061, partial [Tanacetum coccineum]